jgi:hypothetical protein
MRDSNRAAAAFPGAARTALPVPGSARTRVRWLLIVVAIIIVLTAGWPLLNLAVSNNRRISANTHLVVGPSRKDSARVTIGPGWSMLSAESNPHLGYVLRRGAVQVSIDYVTLIDHAHAGGLWAGMRELVRIGHPGATLSAPRPVSTVHHSEGDIGKVSGRNLVGTATVFADTSRDFAIEMVVLSPRRAVRANLIAAQRIIFSLLFLPTSR